MATVIFRPSADASGGTGTYCSKGSSRYALINEETADDDAGYIYSKVSEVGTITNNSKYALTPVQTVAGKFRVNYWTIYARSRITTNSDVSVNYFYSTLITGTSSMKTEKTALSSNYTTFSSMLTVSDNLVYADISELGEIFIYISTGGGKKESKDDNYQIRTTQVYVVLDYTPVGSATATGLYFKQNSAYTQANTVWKKENGLWVKQTDLPAIFSGESSGSASNYVYGGSV